MYYVYILRCADNSLYIGITSDIKRRLQYHNSGNVKYTKMRTPVTLEYTEEYTDKHISALREKQLKGWTRIKKENLIKKGIPY